MPRKTGLWLLLCASALLVHCGSDDTSESKAAPQTECSDGPAQCSDDGLSVQVCNGGKLETTNCMQSAGQLCEAGACVDPWSYGSPSFDQCAGDPDATPESLADKAAYFEDAARRLHIHPKLGWLSDVELPCDGSDCTKSGVPETTATWQDVQTWKTGENDGLWSALYMGAEAYRWAVTKDPEALDTLKLLLESETTRMRITGVPGIFTRQMIPPGVAGIACPTDLSRYVPDKEKDDNQWVKIGADGCIQTVDGATMQWTSSSVCGLGDYVDWCWLDNVSEDEYAGHMFGLGAVAKLVGDPDVQASVKNLLSQVGDHLIENQLEFKDWDGRTTEHGKIWAWLVVGGYNATMSLSFMKTIAEATGDPKYQQYYDDCLLQRSGPKDCFDNTSATDKPYDEILTPTGLYLSCKANWNNFSMHMLSLHGLIWGEHDPELRKKVQDALATDMWNPPDEQRPLSEQNNSFFDFIYAADKALGPGSDGPATAAVENGICMLRQFPAHKIQKDLSCPASQCVEVCQDRFGDPMTDYPRPIAQRCLKRFVWWASPYGTQGCNAEPRVVYSPADYLLAYWMGRYYGFIATES